MPSFKPSIRRYAAANSTARHPSVRDAFRRRNTEHAVPIIPTCPAPTCICADTPPGLVIDTSTDLNSTMAPYAEHLLVSSGQANWSSRIEDEQTTAPWGELTANVKHEFGLKGRFRDPYHNVMVTAVSFETPPHQDRNHTSQALLFPSFRMVDGLKTGQDEIPAFIQSFLLPQKLHPAHGHLSEEETKQKIRTVSDFASSPWAGKVRPITSPTILICSHESRDSRCGILGPLLHAEFTQYINRKHTLRQKSDDLVDREEPTDPVQSFASHPNFSPDFVDREKRNQRPINVGMISHIGGHKFAGNVIIYIPPDYQCHPIQRASHGAESRDGGQEPLSTPSTSQSNLLREGDVLESMTDSTSPLAGTGIWYGRVEPRHVEGIVEQTLGQGRIIKDLFRGGINQDGSQIRLPLY